MTIELPVVNPKQKCNQCGGCCRVIPLSASPAQLRVNILIGNQTQTPNWYQSRQISRALEGRCLGRLTFPNGEMRFAYGPCRNLVETDTGPICAINDIKPRLCHTYPYFEDRVIDDLFCPLPDNPGFVRGCGYNLDPSAGYSEAELMSMITPLLEGDK